jgi:hypothetical protein
LAEPSGEVISSAEKVAIAENRLRLRKLERELEENEDWFRERETREMAQIAGEQEAEEQQREAEQRRQGEIEKVTRRREWFDRWQKYALRSIPSGARDQVESAVYEAVSQALAKVEPTQDEAIVQRLVDSVFERAMAPWRRRQNILRAAEEARDTLPCALKGFSWSPTEWDIKARQLAAKAIEQGLGPDASYDEMRTVAKKAVKSIVAEYEDMELRKRIVSWASLPWGLTEEEKGLVRETIERTLSVHPIGTSREKLERTCDKFLADLNAEIARRKREQAQNAARQAEEDRSKRQADQDREARETVMRYASWHFPYDIPGDQREPLLTAIRKALDGLPSGTPQQQLEQARDQTIKSFRDTLARRKQQAELIEGGLREIHAFIVMLEREWEFDLTLRELEAELAPAVRRRLEAELKGTESPEDVGKRVQRIVREELGFERRKVVVRR